jgi:hypothetical protein
MALSCPKCEYPLIKSKEEDVLPGNTLVNRLKILFHPSYVAKQRVPQTSKWQANFWIGLAGATAVTADAIEPFINGKVNYQPPETLLSTAANAFIVGGLITVIIAFISSIVIQWIGNYLGLMTMPAQIRALFAWSTPPVFIWALMLLSQWLVYIPDYAYRNYEIQKVQSISEFGLWWLTSGVIIVSVACFLLTFIFLIVGLAEIGKSLLWSSLATVTLAGMIVGGLFLVISIIFSGLMLVEN